MVKPITAQSVEDDVLLPSWVQFAVWTNLKEFECVGHPSVFDGAGLLKSDVS